MKGYIDKKAFLAWIKEEFSGVISTHFDYELAESVIDYANSIERNVDFIYEIFPEITREEIQKFIV